MRGSRLNWFGLVIIREEEYVMDGLGMESMFLKFNAERESW